MIQSIRKPTLPGSLLIAFGFVLFITGAFAQDIQPAQNAIRINQIGYFPGAPKLAVVVAKNKGYFKLTDEQGKALYKDKLIYSGKDLGDDSTWTADFSAFSRPGDYYLDVAGLGRSYKIHIRPDVMKAAGVASIKAYYFMRASTALPEKYAGKWHRAEGHPDTAVLVHPSAATDKRPAGSKISASRGWYDAGDYNKYIVNSGISTSTLLSLYEDFPDHMEHVVMNIPESGDGVPDVLNEALWNIRWMLCMQDPDDGGVYNKLTNAVFDKMEMPDKATAARYIVQKGTAATLDFAAVMAQSSRIFRRYAKQLPGLADSCLHASQKAWEWAVKNPDVYYRQNEMNKHFKPEVTTGGYGDYSVKDEFAWAAAELLVTTHDRKYTDAVNTLREMPMHLQTWSQVDMLAYFTLLRKDADVAELIPDLLPVLNKKLIAFAEALENGSDQTAFRAAIYKSPRSFNWGSNSNAANQGIVFIRAYTLTGDHKYLQAALDNLDYLLGRNGTGYCYVTGEGDKSPMHPHHRPSVADGVVDPVPGLMVGGPNPGMQDGIKVPSVVPDRAYIDDDRAYAVNEIAINWNAPFAYLVNGIEALQKELGDKR